MEKINIDQKTANYREELFFELEQCREDERNAQNAILTVISTAGTMLSITLAGSLFFSKNDEDAVILGVGNSVVEFLHLSKYAEYFTLPRAAFILSNCVLCTAIFYIIILGLANVVRYHYIRNIEDELFLLERNEKMIHWNTFEGAIVSRNLRHLEKSKGIVNHICYGLAAFFAILFCVVLTETQLLRINNISKFDIGCAALPFVAVALAIFIMLRGGNLWMKEVEKIALNYRKRRLFLNKEQQKSHKDLIKYLIHPKIKEKQKMGLGIVGFAITMLASVPFTWDQWWAGIGKLLFITLIIEGFAYPIRYFYNDLHGIKESTEEKEEKIPEYKEAYENGENDKIRKIVFGICCSVFFRICGIIVSIFLYFYWWGSEAIELMLYLVLLLISTILYERARDKGRKLKTDNGITTVNLRNTIWIYILVGCGYPIRFFGGCLAAKSVMEYSILNSPFLLWNIVVLIAYGSFSAVLSWENALSRKSSFIRTHFYVMQNVQVEKGKEYIEKGKNRLEKTMRWLLTKLVSYWSLLCLILNIGISVSLLIMGWETVFLKTYYICLLIMNLLTFIVIKLMGPVEPWDEMLNKLIKVQAVKKIIDTVLDHVVLGEINKSKE